LGYSIKTHSFTINSRRIATPVSGLLLGKRKADEEFRWGQNNNEHSKKSKNIWQDHPCWFLPSGIGRSTFMSVGDTSIASVVVQVYDSKKKIVFYLNRRMLDTETRYHEMEKLCLCLFFTCTKLWHILLFVEIIIICKSDIIKHMLSAPVLKGRLRKWMFALSEFDIRYQNAKEVKGQALADLIVERININIATLSVRAWAMYFDGSACEDGRGIGILLVSPQGVTNSFSIRLPASCTNNLAEYEAVRREMELLVEAGAEAVEVFGDSMLVISQLTEEYMCESESLFLLWMQCHELMT
jgi:hypothetical protein